MSRKCGQIFINIFSFRSGTVLHHKTRMLQGYHSFEEAFFFVQLTEKIIILAIAHDVANIAVDGPFQLLAHAVDNERQRRFGECGTVVIIVVDLFAAGLYGRKSERTNRRDIEMLIELQRPAIGIDHVVDKNGRRFMRFKSFDGDAALFFHAFGIGERHAGSAGTEPARIDAQYDLPGMRVMIIFFVEARHDIHDLIAFTEGVHHTDACGQFAFEMQATVELYDMICQCQG